MIQWTDYNNQQDEECHTYKDLIHFCIAQPTHF